MTNFVCSGAFGGLYLWSSVFNSRPGKVSENGDFQFLCQVHSEHFRSKFFFHITLIALDVATIIYKTIQRHASVSSFLVQIFVTKIFSPQTRMSIKLKPLF